MWLLIRRLQTLSLPQTLKILLIAFLAPFIKVRGKSSSFQFPPSLHGDRLRIFPFSISIHMLPTTNIYNWLFRVWHWKNSAELRWLKLHTENSVLCSLLPKTFCAKENLALAVLCRNDSIPIIKFSLRKFINFFQKLHVSDPLCSIFLPYFVLKSLFDLTRKTYRQNNGVSWCCKSWCILY